MTKEVPCCRGLLTLAQEAQVSASRTIPLNSIIISIKGEIQKEERINQ